MVQLPVVQVTEHCDVLAPPERLAALFVPVHRRRVQWPLRCMHPAATTLAVGRVVDVDHHRPIAEEGQVSRSS